MQQEHAAAPTNLTDVDHWSRVYRKRESLGPMWTPKSYEDQIITQWLLGELRRCRAETALEVGCGDSVWLPYLARQAGLRHVAGIDYSEAGCDMLRRRLQKEDIAGDVYCADVFDADPERIGRFDFVYSLGLIEHFPDLPAVLRQLKSFVRPGGTLVNEVPNLYSAHGLAMRIWQPTLMDKHVCLSRRRLHNAHQALGMSEVRSWHVGLASLAVVAWEVDPRWPRLARALVPAIRWFQGKVMQPVLAKLSVRRGLPFLAPYLFVSGKVPHAPFRDMKPDLVQHPTLTR